jgi:hypothetical protein
MGHPGTGGGDGVKSLLPAVEGEKSQNVGGGVHFEMVWTTIF